MNECMDECNDTSLRHAGLAGGLASDVSAILEQRPPGGPVVMPLWAQVYAAIRCGQIDQAAEVS
jgi:hypothetical protein